MASEQFKNFRKIEAHVDTRGILHELDSQAEHWALNRLREDKVSVQRETNSILLRGVPLVGANRTVDEINDTHDSVEYPIAQSHPETMRFLYCFADKMDSDLCRAMIVRLRPSGRVYRHIDTGQYYAVRERYHLVLRSSAGSPLTVGEESAVFAEGEVWWFNNKMPHEASNPSTEWRIHLIFDLLKRNSVTLCRETGSPVRAFGRP